jgi:hypothetical protein
VVLFRSEDSRKSMKQESILMGVRIRDFGKSRDSRVGEVGEVGVSLDQNS